MVRAFVVNAVGAASGVVMGCILEDVDEDIAIAAVQEVLDDIKKTAFCHKRGV